MKFISNFTDFYDYAGIGYDSNLVYERKTKHIRLDDRDLFNIVPEFFSSDYKIAMKPWHTYKREKKTSVIDRFYYPFVIVFCGIVTVGVAERKSGSLEIVHRYEPNIRKTKGKMSWYSYREEAELNYFSAKRNNVRERMLELGYPILYLTHENHVLNPRLIATDFHLQMDATQAYQEMEMFVGEMQSIEKDVKIEDKYLKKQKGFGDCSFKKC